LRHEIGVDSFLDSNPAIPYDAPTWGFEPTGLRATLNNALKGRGVRQNPGPRGTGVFCWLMPNPRSCEGVAMESP